MDPAKNGRITYADLAAFLNRAKNGNRLAYEAARARLALAMRGTTPAQVAAAGGAPVLVALGVLAAGRRMEGRMNSMRRAYLAKSASGARWRWAPIRAAPSPSCASSHRATYAT